MPIETRTIKQGIPPRVRSPVKKKTKARKDKKKASSKKRSRDIEVSDDEESELESPNSESDQLEVKKKKKRQRGQVEELSDSDSDGVRKKKKKCVKRAAPRRSEQEEEVVEAIAGETVENVVNIQADEEEVSISLIEKCILHSQDNDRTLTGLMATNWQRGDSRLEEKLVKKDSTRDLLTMMSDRVTVKFQVGTEKFETETGRWCNTCKSVFVFDSLNATGAYFTIGLMTHLSNVMESARLSIRGATRPVAFTFVSTMKSTRTNVKRGTYQCTIGQFHGRSGRKWRKRRRQRRRGRLQRSRNNSSWISRP
jgi:hypothetical protein